MLRASVTVRYGICSVCTLGITIAVVKVSQCNIHPIMAASREMVSRRATEALWSTPSSVAPSVSSSSCLSCCLSCSNPLTAVIVSGVIKAALRMRNLLAVVKVGTKDILRYYVSYTSTVYYVKLLNFRNVAVCGNFCFIPRWQPVERGSAGEPLRLPGALHLQLPQLLPQLQQSSHSR